MIFWSLRPDFRLQYGGKAGINTLAIDGIFEKFKKCILIVIKFILVFGKNIGQREMMINAFDTRGICNN
jgi:hypothetical protein